MSAIAGVAKPFQPGDSAKAHPGRRESVDLPLPEDRIVARLGGRTPIGDRRSERAEMSRDQVREIKQLLHAAVNFYRLAKRAYDKLSTSQRKLTVIDVATSFERNVYPNDENRISIVISYLSSAAIRISTIDEVLGLKPQNDTLYKQMDMANIHHYLRDNIAHKEPDACAKQDWLNRQRFIDEKSVEDLYLGISKAMVSCRGNLLSLAKGFDDLAKFARRYRI
jgi:hypothetical protein